MLYDKADWKPQLTTNNNKAEPVLTIRQKEVTTNKNNIHNKWSVNLSKSTPLSLNVKIGAGETKLNLQNSNINRLELNGGAVSCNLDLRGSKIRDLELNAGVGELNLDLRGNWDHSVQVNITGGIGDVNIKLPKNTGVRLKSSGLGSNKFPGMQQEDGYYTNKAYGKSKHVITINVSGGLGSVTAQQED